MSINVQEIDIVPAKSSLGELSNKIYYRCCFCEKMVGLPTEVRKLCERLSGGDVFYCRFCLRNNFNTKNNKHILPLSFRGIIAYYYYTFYCGKTKTMWISEIKDYVRVHETAGLQNPIFQYDPESFMWFVDFSKVGRGRKKVKIKEIHKTISSILACFNIYRHVPSMKMNKLYEKYEEAINKFHEYRYRPKEKKLLIPTVFGCIKMDKQLHIDCIRNFSKNYLKEL